MIIPDIILTKLIAVITSLSMVISGFIGTLGQTNYQIAQPNAYNIDQMFPKESQKFGSVNFVAGNKFYLSGSGIGTSDTSITVDSFTTPDGIELSMTDFGTIGYATIEPGGSKKEFISFTGVSQAGATTKATLTGVSRGLRFVSPYTASTSLALSHSGGSVLIISNPPQFYNELAGKNNAETITGIWTFSSSSMPKLDAYKAPTDNTQFAAKKYVDDTASAGAADATESVKGLVEIATKAELNSATTTGGTGAIIVPPMSMVLATSSATTSIVATNGSGKISQGFLDLTQSYAWSGAHSNTATTTLATTTITNLQATQLNVLATTSLATTTVNGIDLKPLINGGDTSLHYHLGNCYTGQYATTGAGTVAIPHGLGATPGYVQINAMSLSFSGADGMVFSYGTATSTAYQSSIGVGKSDATEYLAQSNSNIITMSGVAASLSALTSTTFSLNFSGTFVGTQYIQWTVCK